MRAGVEITDLSRALVTRILEVNSFEPLIEVRSSRTNVSKPRVSDASSGLCDTRAVATTSGLWEPEMFRLFVSHASSHRVEVGQLRDALNRRGVSAFVAHTDIAPTLLWQGAIETALQESDALLAYLTPEFHVSLWTDQEVGIAYGRGIPVVPIRMGIDPYGFIGKIQGLPGLGKPPEVLAAEITDTLMRNRECVQRMGLPVVASFERSYSFDNARENFSRLKALPEDAWSDELIDRVRQAIPKNDQLENASVRTTTGWQTLPAATDEYFDSIGWPRLP